LAGAPPPPGAGAPRPPPAPAPAAPPAPRPPAHPSAPVPAPPAGVSVAPSPSAPTVFTRPPTAQPASRAGELWALVAAASLGAFATLAGVAVGWALARSTPRPR